MSFLTLSLLAGMVLGQRFRVHVLVLSLMVLLVVTIGIGLVRQDGFGPILLTAALVLASLEIGYMAGIAIRYAMAAARAYGRRGVNDGGPSSAERGAVG